MLWPAGRSWCWRLGLEGRPASGSRGVWCGWSTDRPELAGLGLGGVPGLARPAQAGLIARAWVVRGCSGTGAWVGAATGAHAVRAAVAQLGGRGLRCRGARPRRAWRRRPGGLPQSGGALGSGSGRPSGRWPDRGAWWCALAAGPGRVDRAGLERVALGPGSGEQLVRPAVAVARPSTGGPAAASSRGRLQAL